MARQLDYANATPGTGYEGYPSSYENDVFPTDGLGFLGAVPDGYVGFATVDTNDPPPAGDLKIHQSPSASSAQIGGADKGGGVAVRGDQPAAPGWAYVGWGGSSRNPAVNGYASLAYLTAVTAQPNAPAPPINPAPGPAPQPGAPVAPGEESSSALFYGALVVGALVVGGAAYLLLRRKKRAH